MIPLLSIKADAAEFAAAAGLTNEKL